MALEDVGVGGNRVCVAVTGCGIFYWQRCWDLALAVAVVVVVVVVCLVVVEQEQER